MNIKYLALCFKNNKVSAFKTCQDKTEKCKMV